ncbi:MAG: hypothetical protein FWE83_11450 [Oscillospiraceae bacterium]|nr:hypothetical protein [Oscillospiraceae bacterium]
MRYGEFVFYDTDVLSLDKKSALLRECKDACYNWQAHKIDCTDSISRTANNYSFDEVLEHLCEKSHVVVINRGIWGNPAGEDREYFEVGFCTMEPPVEHFLFINVYSDKMPPLLDKYNLTPMAA